MRIISGKYKGRTLKCQKASGPLRIRSGRHYSIYFLPHRRKPVFGIYLPAAPAVGLEALSYGAKEVAFGGE